MNQLVFASENQGKLTEVSKFAAQYDVEVLSPSQAGLTAEKVEETGGTYEENAKLKIQPYLNQKTTNELVICGDDSGIEIEALNNEPGLHSRRWLGYEMSDEEIISYALERLKGIDNRKVVSKTTLAYSAFGSEIKYIAGKLEGEVAPDRIENAIKVEGLPFRELFIVDADPPIPLWDFERLSLSERKGRLSYREAAFLGLFQALDWTK